MEQLHIWFQKNQRSFPWREARTPYKVWISEVMLQQTRAVAVIPYFLRWMKLFPNSKALAAASLEEVIKAWEGLGYYSRARNLHAGAKQIVERFSGELPDSKEALASIRGLGPYTIGAILSFGFHKRMPALDGNVARVMSRYLAFTENICRTKARRFLEKKVEELLDEKYPWITMEALIELGATICLPKPHCEECALKINCLGLQKKMVETLPIKNVAPPMIVLRRIVLIIASQKRYLVRKGAARKIMADLYEFPYLEIEQEMNSFEEIESKVADRFNLKAKCISILPETTHTFTKYKARLFPYLLQTNVLIPVSEWVWIHFDELLNLPFSAGHRKIARSIQTYCTADAGRNRVFHHERYT